MLFGGIVFASWRNGAQEEDLSGLELHIYQSRKVVSI